jgi:hypothetical protein
VFYFWKEYFMPNLQPIFMTITEENTRISQRIANQPDKYTAIRHLTDTLVDLVRSLAPVPKDPAAHLQAAHQQARPYLGRLLLFDPAAEVVVNENNYSYTPRKVLRRVLDHNIDHLNHIEQTLLWQQGNFTPTPADGWVPSTVNLSDDFMPLSEVELKAWLWRIDITVQTTALRLSRLTEAQLHWSPPDSGWSIFTIVHHLAGAELYYATSLEMVLPTDTSIRFQEAAKRIEQAVEREMNQPFNASEIYFHDEQVFSLEALLQQIVAEQKKVS